MYRITIHCDGVPASAGAQAARDLAEALRRDYPHERLVACSFLDGTLRIVVENDYDAAGLNLMDEVSDLVSANLGPFDGDLKLVSVETLR
ncbi:hypothetical protein [Falsiroseomonas ponticola]|uniref:hypothetical protein n=1 Tax=Falsiroseomonas ponticola TaxID=2786951 RepID=UPI00193173F6|nr:hypothetical protein [Roseomonas ponticola]